MTLWCQKKGRVHAQGLEQNYWIVVCKIERVSANKFAYGVRIQNYLLKAGSHGWRSRDSGRGVLLYEATHVVACENRSAHNFRFGIGMWTFCPHTQDNMQRSLILKLFPLIQWAFSSDLVYWAVLQRFFSWQCSIENRPRVFPTRQCKYTRPPSTRRRDKTPGCLKSVTG